ncbi:hypothetical protein BGX34_005595 [Mortierella sp. NVP85]|nr:hypothetical protein BGX34_005595 [Mortierella sp. NVP85]
MAVIAIQSCLAIDDGIYAISLDAHSLLSVQEARFGIPARLEPPQVPNLLQRWQVVNDLAQGTIVIRHAGTGLYLAPSDPAEKQDRDAILLSKNRFDWRLIPKQDGGPYYIERADTQAGERALVFGRSPNRMNPPGVETQVLQPYNPAQEWTFMPLHFFYREELREHCGPWRLQRESFYLQ